MDLYTILLAIILGAAIGAFFFMASGGHKVIQKTPTTTEKSENGKEEKTTDSSNILLPKIPKEQVPGYKKPAEIFDVTVLYASQRNASKAVAKEIAEAIAPKLRPFRVSSAINIADLNNVEDLREHKRIVFVLPTYEGGTPPPAAAQFAADLLDLVQDFRVSRDFFSRQRIAVLGLGDAQYAKHNFCKFAKDVTHYFITLGAERMILTMCVDEPYVQSSTVTFTHKLVAAIQRGSSVEEEKRSKEKYLDEKKFKEAQDERDAAAAVEFGSKTGCCSNNKKKDSSSNNNNDDDQQQQKQSNNKGCGSPNCCSSENTSNSKKSRRQQQLEERKNKKLQKQEQATGISAEDVDKKNAEVESDTDDEDNKKKNDDNDAAEEAEGEDEEYTDDDGSGSEGDIEEIIAAPRKQMLYPRLRRNLEKEGYGLIGSHSGVKLCRWTKSMLRGRGGCYKHTFYNISSFQCMEMTPSLACANKCVFCWRHHTNPVARTFQWEHDPPQFLVEGGISRHQNMIRAMRGVPGVIPSRLEEAMSVKHCALSLVGEPIMYPEINKFLTLLHEKHISSFLVTNAQFPEQMENLVPCTQLYVSVDASTPEDLKAIDRPLFEDYWERMMSCIKELARKPFRTVFRLTLVNSYNMENLKEYTDLIRLGNPHFVEVKGVTFCGAGSASDLTMKNIPYHQEVVKFCEGLCALLPGYEIACEHEHSCCMLIAKKTFKIEGKWHTWIDYKKFFELVDSGRTDFTALEYAMETPEWAVFDSSEHGFDPKEVRHKRGVPITGAGC